MKYLFIVVLSFCLCLHSFAQSSRQNLSHSVVDNIWERSLIDAFGNVHWITRPLNRTITVVGIAERNYNKDKAISDALLDAARRVSLYHGVYGEVTVIYQESPNILETVGTIPYKQLDIYNEAESFIGTLMFNKDKDVYEKDGAVYVRARYTGVIDIPSYKSEITMGVPSWVREYQAEIPGFLVGIGVSGNKGSPQKTYIASYEEALISILFQVYSKIADSIIDVEEHGQLTQNITKSKGDLSSVMILETWHDKRTGTVWTLLVAKKAE